MSYRIHRRHLRRTPDGVAVLDECVLPGTYAAAPQANARVKGYAKAVKNAALVQHHAGESVAFFKGCNEYIEFWRGPWIQDEVAA